MAVTGKKVGRLDIRLVRGDTQRVGGRWRKRNMQTGEITPVDLPARSNCARRTGGNCGLSMRARR